jgi:hypothetical protein
MNNFTYTSYKNIFKSALERGYRIITLKEYFEGNYSDDEKILVNRIDVDIAVKRLPKILEIYQDLDIKGSFYLRLHSPTYNLMSFGNINIVKELLQHGHEIGLHTELMDAEGYSDVNAVKLLKAEIHLLETAFDCKLFGTASHGDLTPHNNLHFWKTHMPSEFGLLYEAYDSSLWENCRYVSDSEWIKWKAYDQGKLIQGDLRDPVEHMEDNVKVLNLLTHPASWYEKYIHE